jgi:hypothetical protein
MMNPDVLDNCITVDDYISSIDKLASIVGYDFKVEITASYNNVAFCIGEHEIDALEDYSGTLRDLRAIFVDVKDVHGNVRIDIESGYNNAGWYEYTP